MFGINGAELLVLLLVIVLVVGPERLPSYAEQLGRWTRGLRGYVSTAKERVAAELGEQGQEVDWASLDPRRYDPRRIVREALMDDVADRRPQSAGQGRVTRMAHGASAAGASVAGTTSAGGDAAPAPVTAPFDDEAT